MLYSRVLIKDDEIKQKLSAFKDSDTNREDYLVSYQNIQMIIELYKCKNWNKEKVLLKLLSKALGGLWTKDRAATNQMTIPFDKLPWQTWFPELAEL